MQYRPHRYPTQYPIQVRTTEGAQKGYVLDVNNEGARLQGVGGLRRGDKVRLEVLSHHIEAIVLRVARDQVGIVFRPKLSDNFVDTIRRRQDGRLLGGHGCVGFGYAEMR